MVVATAHSVEASALNAAPISEKMKKVIYMAEDGQYFALEKDIEATMGSTVQIEDTNQVRLLTGRAGAVKENSV